MAFAVVPYAKAQAPASGSPAMDLTGKVICIDPGHPSEVGRGTAGRHISEIAAAWDVALRLKAILTARGATVVMTKSSEYEFVRNRRRAEIANDAHADLMIRLHCDANSGTGIATYAPDRQGVAADGFRGPTAAVISESQTAARRFHAAMIATLGGALHDKGVLPDTETAVGGRQGALTGSIYSKVPVVLVEMCVLTNPKDEDFIRSARGQDLMAHALADGVAAAVR